MNATSEHTLIAVFRDRAAAQAAVDDLKANGFTSCDIYGTDNSGTSTTTTTEAGHHEGGIIGWFKSLFGDEDTTESTRYETAVQRGNVAVRAQVDAGATDRAAEILNDHSPVNLHDEDASTDQYATGSRQYATGTAAAASTAAATNEYATERNAATRSGARTGETLRDAGTQSIPVIQEELQVGKRVVQRGGVRVYARTVEQPVSEDVTLREETVRVERTPVNRQATGADLQPGKEQVFEAQEFREEPVISKQARVVEEVRIGKQANERVETVRDTVRRTEVNVEKLDASQTGAGTGRVEAGYEGARTGTSGAYDNDPGYQYGVTASSDPRYSGRSYEDVENDLRTDYSRRYPGSTWEEVKSSVRRGWDKVSAKAHGA